MRHIPLLALAAALCGCNRTPHTTQASTAPETPAGQIVLTESKLERIRVEEVRTAELPVDEVTAPGKVEADPQRVSRLMLPVAGRVREVFVRPGDTVNEGQPLLTVDSAEAGAAHAAWRQAQAQLRAAKSALAKTESDLARMRELHQHRAAALKDVLAAQNDFAQAQAEVEQAQAAADEAQHRLELLGLKPGLASPNVTLRAPIAGKVLELAVAPGEYRTDTSAPLITLADLRTVWVTSEVPESAIRWITPGERVRIELAAYPGEVFVGRVCRIAGMLDPETRTLKVHVEVDNPRGRLRPGMFGRISH